MAVSLVKVTKLPTGASSGITARAWNNMVRGESEPGALRSTELASAPRIPGTLKIRVGHGARA